MKNILTKFWKMGLITLVIATTLLIPAVYAEVLPDDQNKPDLDVVYIQRLPENTYRYQVEYRPAVIVYDGRYRSFDVEPYILPGREADKRWPVVGEQVIFRAQVKNKGNATVNGFDYAWYIDNEEVSAASGTYSGNLGSGQATPERAFELAWSWEDGPHTIKFVVDPHNAINNEISELNNSLESRTDGYSFVIGVHKPVHDMFMQYKNAVGSYSFEDWMQWHFQTMNTWLNQANYKALTGEAWCPEGSKVNVRIDRIVVYDDPQEFNVLTQDLDQWLVWDGGWNMTELEAGRLGENDGTTGNAYILHYIVDTLANLTLLDVGLIHELGHQIGLIDYYQMNLPLISSFDSIAIPGIHFPAGSSYARHFGCHDLEQCWETSETVMSEKRWQENLYTTYEFGLHEVQSLNVDYGYFDTNEHVQRNLPKRRGFYGESQLNIPAENRIRLVDASNNPVSEAHIKVYHHIAGWGLYDFVKFQGDTDQDGYWNFPHTVDEQFLQAPWGTGMTYAANPFSLNFTAVPSHVGYYNVLFLAIDYQGGTCYRWLDIGDFNYEYWRGGSHAAQGTYTLSVSFEQPNPYAAPIPVGGLRAFVTTPGSITLRWVDRSDNENGFTIERGFSNMSELTNIETFPIATVAAGQTTYTDNNLNAGVIYYYRVNAYNNYGVAPSTLLEANLNLHPVAPSGLTASASVYDITISWQDNSAAEDGFLILRSTDNVAFYFLDTASVNGVTYTDRRADPDTTYYYKVVAYNGVGAYASEVVSAALVMSTTPPAAPSNVKALESEEKITISWQDNSDDEYGFRILRSTDSSVFTTIHDGRVGLTQYIDPDVSLNMTYYYKVEAYNHAGATASDVVTITMLPTPPAAPTNLTATLSAPHVVTLNWQDTSGTEDGFIIMRTTGSPDTLAEIARVPANTTTYIDTNQNLYAYWVYYKVQAYNAIGSSDSNQVGVTFIPASPVSIGIVAPINGTSAAGEAVTFSATLTDQNGWQDIGFVILYFEDTQRQQSFFVQYLIASNSFQTKSGSAIPGAANPDGSDLYLLDSNAPGYKFNCTRSSAIRSNDTLTLNWNIVFENAASGVKSMLVYAFDNHPTVERYQNGSWIVLAAPTPPLAPTGLTATAPALQTANLSWQDTSNNETGFKVLRRMSNTVFAEVASLPANATSFNDAGLRNDTLYYYKVEAYNNAGPAASNVANVRTLTTKPVVGTVTPASGAAPANTPVTLTATYADANGWQDLKEVFILIYAPPSASKSIWAYYNENENKLYMIKDYGAISQAITPGAKNPDNTDIVIENSYGSLNCSQTTVSGSGTTLAVNWSIVFKNTFIGTKNVYLGAKDEVSQSTQPIKGTWTVQ